MYLEYIKFRLRSTCCYNYTGIHAFLHLCQLLTNSPPLLFLMLQQRHNLTDRIVTACDDYSHLLSQGMGSQNTALRVSFSMAELRSANLSERLRLDPLRHLRALEASCHLIADEERPGYDIKSGRFKKLKSVSVLICHILQLYLKHILHLSC
jgi:hypothetical protein